MHKIIAHHLLTELQPIPEQQLGPRGQIPWFNLMSMMLYVMGYPFMSAVLAMLLHSFFCVSLLAE